MPKEDRRIIFTADEVYNAIYALAVKKQLPKPPAGAVTDISEKADDPTQVIIKLENPAEGIQDTREYARDFLAAALMVFCRGAGIPLPKNAKKSVMVKDGQAILRVQK